jgi:predicted ATPase with chaperone activity
MEDKVVTISGAKGSLTFSANFQLIAAMNPCPCRNNQNSLEITKSDKVKRKQPHICQSLDQSTQIFEFSSL